jgi:hypothetical protein
VRTIHAWAITAWHRATICSMVRDTLLNFFEDPEKVLATQNLARPSRNQKRTTTNHTNEKTADYAKTFRTQSFVFFVCFVDNVTKGTKRTDVASFGRFTIF